MKKKSLYIVDLSSKQGQQSHSLGNTQKFTDLFQTAILLSLLERGQLTKWQFDFCLDELAKQNKLTQPPGHVVNL